MEKEISDYILYFQNNSVIIIENDINESRNDKYQQYQQSLDHESEE